MLGSRLSVEMINQKRYLAILITGLLLFVNVVGFAHGGHYIERVVKDDGYLTEMDHFGLGVQIGGLNSIKMSDVNDDGNMEIIIGNNGGFVHILQWNDELESYIEVFQSKSLGGGIRGIDTEDVDGVYEGEDCIEDCNEEIIITANFNDGSNIIMVMDGVTFQVEDEYTSLGLIIDDESGSGGNEMATNGLMAGLVDDIDEPVLVVGSEKGNVWIIPAMEPNENRDLKITCGEVLHKIELDELNWENSPEGAFKNAWSVTLGDFNGDGDNELAFGSKNGYVAVVNDLGDYDPNSCTYVNEPELIWYCDIDQIDDGGDCAQGNSNDGRSYLVYAHDLNLNGIDELIMAIDDAFYVVVDGDFENPHFIDINQGYGVVAGDVYTPNDGQLPQMDEIVVMTQGGWINIVRMTMSGGEPSFDIIKTWNTGPAGKSLGTLESSPGGGVDIEIMGNGESRIVHGGDLGVITLWSLKQSDFSNEGAPDIMWSSDPAFEGLGAYSLPGGRAWSTTIANIDDDENMEILVGYGGGLTAESGATHGRVVAFDGVNKNVDWVSPILECCPNGIEVVNLDADSDLEILIGTGQLAPQRPVGNNEQGLALGYLYVFDKDSDGIYSETEAQARITEQDELDAILGLSVGETDGSTYPEIIVSTSYYALSQSEQTPHGYVHTYGFDGNGYEQEWKSSDLGNNPYNGYLRGAAAGNLDGDSLDEFVIGTERGKVIVFEKSGSEYSRIDKSTGMKKTYGIEIGDVNDDGDVEVLVGTSLPNSGDGNAKIIVYNYNGNGLEEDDELTISESAGTSLHGVKIGDIDEDSQPEVIYGSSGGLIRIHDLVIGTQQADIQSEGSSQHLSKNIGEFGGIDVGDLDGDETPDLVFGSGSYLWIFQAGDEQDRPDLIIEEFSVEKWEDGEEITELDDLRVQVRISNTWEGTATATYWELLITDGDPREGDYATLKSYSCCANENVDESIEVGETSTEYEFKIPYQYTQPGKEGDDYERKYYAWVTTVVPTETIKNNNYEERIVVIKPVPNEAPVAIADLEKDVAWVNEQVYVQAGDSFDPCPDDDCEFSDTNGEADSLDGEADLQYFFDYGNGWNGPSNYQYVVSFESHGEYEINIKVRDERGSESEITTVMLTVKQNTAPEAILKVVGSTTITVGEDVVFDVSESNDPDGRSDLEYRIKFGDGRDSNWFENGESSIYIFENAQFNPETGNMQSGDSAKDSDGNSIVLSMNNGKLYSNLNTQSGYFYTVESGMEISMYDAILFVREMENSFGDENLLDGFSEIVTVSVERAANNNPIAVAKAGILGSSFSEENGTFNAKTDVLITFTAEGSFDPDQEIDGGELIYHWDLEGPVSPNMLNLGDKEDDRNFNFVFTEPGTYVATVSVYDERGGSSSSTVTVVIEKSATDIAGGLGIPSWILGVIGGIIGLLAVAFVISKAVGGQDEEEYDFESAGGPVELACPNCNSAISIHTDVRPIQVGCPVCSSQFIIRE